jgi:hypothetical protein
MNIEISKSRTSNLKNYHLPFLCHLGSINSVHATHNLANNPPPPMHDQILYRYEQCENAATRGTNNGVWNLKIVFLMLSTSMERNI